MYEISISDVPGFRIGQACDQAAATGCTVVICEEGAVCGVDVRGGSPGTRDTDALNPVNNRERVHAVLLSGGSSFGLDAAGGVMSFLERRGIGRSVDVTVIPNVCAAILFDLKCGSATARPDGQMGFSACEGAFAGQSWQSGNYGAGAGATIGTICGIDRAMKGGVGSCAARHKDLVVGAVVAVNCVGDVIDNQTGEKIAGLRSADGAGFTDSEAAILDLYKEGADLFSQNTILGCIVSNAKLSKAQSTKLATIAHNGIARAVRPAHTIFDGDTIFAMCTGEVETTLDAAGILAARAVERAIIDAVMSAETVGQYVSASDFALRR